MIAVGDEEFQRKCYDYLYDLRRAGTSMIIVSHGLSQITDLCDEAVWLEHGEVRGIGPSRSVVRSYLDDVNEREIIRGAAHGDRAPEADEGLGGEEAHNGEGTTDEGSHDEAPAAPARSSARRGTGEIRVSSVEFVDEAARSSGVLIAGQPAILRIHFVAHQQMQDVYFGFGLFDHAEAPVCGVNSAATGTWTVPPGQGSVEFRGDPWLAAGGKYSVRVMIKSGASIVDAVDEGMSVVVREADVEMAGVYLQPGKWSMQSVPPDGGVVPAGADMGSGSST